MTPERFESIAEFITDDLGKACPVKIEEFEKIAENAMTGLSKIDWTYLLKFLDSYMWIKWEIDFVPISKQVLIEKANGYSMNGDRLWNFKKNYSFMAEDPMVNLKGYVRKHLASCMDILTGKMIADEAMIIEKFGDVFNYCVLAIALMEEQE
jgi:hypothetical protein